MKQDACNDTEKPRKQYAKRKGPGTRATRCITPPTWDVQNRSVHRDRKEISGCQGPGAGGVGAAAMGIGLLFGEIKNVLNLDSACLTLRMYQKSLNRTLEKDEFYGK